MCRLAIAIAIAIAIVVVSRSPPLGVFPHGWQDRLVVVDNPNTNGVRGLCLGPVDIATSKLAAGRPKDLDFIRVLLRERLANILAAFPRD